ncbi:sialate O-acetylesterase [Dysgonomonas sp. 520]|uniref:sialate O-acetylesterase n=1 Tax=Dysgonomonas sp. 520 TaxID=2302931 RepID=UPI0013CFC3C1|nr:sialate O-acetylesterase [Dysgonomonas sp. 520]NDW08587.1 9-O-acetylesterase [Dysgonomonas sp. 520]
MKKIVLLLSLVFCSVSLSAKIVLPKIFTDNMVLQQQTDAPIWGKATPEAAVKIITSWDNQSYSVKADSNGNWKVKVKTPKAGGPYTISVSDGKSLKLNNILIGEVWVCSGQSNMEMPLAGWGKVNDYENEIAKANYPQIRLLHVEQSTSTTPLDDLKATRGGWRECSPETVADFSSVAYFFGRNLNEKLNVPIGLINTSWGGTLAEAWTSGESLEYMPDFRDEVKVISSVSEEEAQRLYEQNFEKWSRNILDNDKGYKNGFPVWANLDANDDSWQEMSLPGFWEEKSLKDFDGIVWMRKVIDIPASWSGKELELNLAMIDDNDITYFNGEKIGETNGYNVPRKYKIPKKLVKAGKAVITVRVTDTGGGGGLYGESANMFLSLSGKKDNAISLSGMWKYYPSINLKDFDKAPQSVAGNPNRPTVLYNAMINPLVSYAIQGAIWYQGEANEERGYQYRELLPLLIRDWRKQWGRDFPFYFVQLANYKPATSEPQESDWAELREAQLQTLCLENTGMAVTIDIGEGNDIHPKNKQDVGLRLALNARAKTYGEKVSYSGPIYDSYQLEGNKIRIRFKHTDNGLKAKNGAKLKGFAIAGSDHKFYWADAVIDKDEVVVYSPKVPFPVSVRYAWADNPDCNLYNGSNLPASPFRTDDWR